MWSVPTGTLDAAHVAAHLAALKCEPNKDKRTMPGVKKPVFFIGHVTGGRLYMPPWYGKLAFPRAIRYRTSYCRGEAMRDGVSFAGKLAHHPPQQQAAQAYLAFLKANMDASACVLTLPCGYGKTVLFLFLASALRRVTLVLVHKLPLLEQWIVEARRFLPAARVGYVRADAQRVEGVDVIIASTQSLCSHIQTGQAYLATLFRRVGFVCMDEGHHAIATTFSSVFNTIPAQYRLVLTATPRRKDGLMDKLQMIGGPVVFRAFRQVGEVHVVCVRYDNATAAPDQFRRVAGGQRVLNYTDMLTALSQDAERNRIVLALIEAQMPFHRRVLVVTCRKDHVTALADALDARFRDAGTAAALARQVSLVVPDTAPRKRRRQKDEGPEDAARLAQEALYAWEDSGPHERLQDFPAPVVGRVVEGMEDVGRRLQYEAAVVVTTTQMMDEGISYNGWDTLVLLNDTSDPEQVVGRILRVCPTKRVPLVLDLWMAQSMFYGLANARRQSYLDEDFDIHDIQVTTVADVPDAGYWRQFDKPAPAVM